MEDLPVEFEWLIHLLEVGVVISIGVIVYITKKYPNTPRDSEGPEPK